MCHVPFCQFTSVLASTTRLANTCHRYDKQFVLADKLSPGYAGTRVPVYPGFPGMVTYHPLNHVPWIVFCAYSPENPSQMPWSKVKYFQRKLRQVLRVLAVLGLYVLRGILRVLAVSRGSVLRILPYSQYSGVRRCAILNCCTLFFSGFCTAGTATYWPYFGRIWREHYTQTANTRRNLRVQYSSTPSIPSISVVCTAG